MGDDAGEVSHRLRVDAVISQNDSGSTPRRQGAKAERVEALSGELVCRIPTLAPALAQMISSFPCAFASLRLTATLFNDARR